MSQFDDWLRALAADGKGPWTLHATRGRLFSYKIAMEGDYTGSTMRGQVRMTPDAAGEPLAQMDIGGPDLLDGYTYFTPTVYAGYAFNSTGALPAPPVGEGSVDFVYDILFTPPGGEEGLLFGGLFTVAGRVTL